MMVSFYNENIYSGNVEFDLKHQRTAYGEIKESKHYDYV